MIRGSCLFLLLLGLLVPVYAGFEQALPPLVEEGENIRDYPDMPKNLVDGILPSFSFTSVRFSPNGRFLISGSSDGSIQFWDIQQNKLITILKRPEDSILSIIFRNGKIFVSGAKGKTIELSGIQKQQLLNPLKGYQDQVLWFIFSPNGQILASGPFYKNFNKIQQFFVTLKDKVSYVTPFYISLNGKILSIETEWWNNNAINLRDIQTQQLIATLKGHQDQISSIDFSPNGKILASGSFNNTIKLWNIQTQQLITTLKGHQDQISSINFSPNGKILASGSFDNTIKLWNIQTQQLIATLKGHQDQISSVHFSPNGKILAAGALNNTIELWDIQNRQLITTLKGQRDDFGLYLVDFFPNGKILTSGSKDKTIKFWDLEKQQLSTILKGHQETINSVSFSSHNKILASGSWDNTIKLWDIENQKLITTLKGHKNSVNAITFSPNGKILASGSSDHTIKLWNIENQKLITTLENSDIWGDLVKFSPDGTILVSGSKQGTIKYWDIERKKLITTSKGYITWADSINFYPTNDTILISGFEYGIIILWDITNRKIITTLKGHENSVHSINFSPNGKILASGSFDHTIKLWNIEKQKLISTLKGHKNPVTSTKFITNQILLSVSIDGQIKLWDLNKNENIADLISDAEGNWLWYNKKTGQFWRNDNGHFLLQKDYTPLPPPNLAKQDSLEIIILTKNFQISSDKTSNLKLKITNTGDKPVWWLRTLQTEKSPFIVYPKQHNKLKPHATTILTIPISAYVKETPKPFKKILNFELVSAAGTHFPIEIPVSVATPDLILKSIQLQDDQQTLKIILENKGDQGIKKAFFKLGPWKLDPQPKYNIKPHQRIELAFVLPKNTEINKQTTASLEIWTEDLPLFQWNFSNQSIILPTSPWLFYLLLLGLFIIIIQIWIFFRRYRHPLLLKLSENSQTLLTVLPEQLKEAQQRLKQTNRLSKVLADIKINDISLQEAINFIDSRNIEWLADHLNATVNKRNNYLFSFTFSKSFPLNITDNICLFYFPPKDCLVDKVFKKLDNILKKLNNKFTVIIIGKDSIYQDILRKTTLDLTNQWVAPNGAALTTLLLSPNPEKVLAKIIAEQISLIQISPYQTGGGVERDSIFFGRQKLISNIINRDLTNYLLIAGRQLGKSSLLKALERRYQDQSKIDCFYYPLANENIVLALADRLKLPFNSSLNEIISYLKNSISEEQKQYLFLIDEADDFIKYERNNKYMVLKALRTLSEGGNCSFILAGFWHLYDYSVLDYQSPLKNFGEILELGTLEYKACQQLTTEPMATMGICYDNDNLIKLILEQTGQRPNLIAICCNEILQNLNNQQPLINEKDVKQALNSDAIKRALSGWQNLTGDDIKNQIDRVIIYSMIKQEKFSLTELVDCLKDHGFNFKVTALEHSLARLNLAFILRLEEPYYIWRVPLFYQYLRGMDLIVRLKGELKNNL